ncbi:mitochondrial thiamine pyrophosphate carrier-like [Eriocheir sinensis]|uniref:mitochondrial thiamine pyrophosphate carrier-like n=1 Tax=Eriocheir sinensis TaxID=95602 RepID=UPI0021C8EFC5|nr:mitochondrial thiamine pyrophosphate carrier-like [Eriocheir sinensis]
MVSHVGYKAEKQDQLSPWDHAFAGAASGAISRALLQPLDVLKIRFQLQVEPIAKRGGGLYQGLLQSTHTIVKTEGVSALWKGHVTAQALSVSFGLVQFWSYSLLTKAASEHGAWEGHLSQGMCGALAGLCATLFSFPCDTVRTRLIAQGYPKRYTGMVDAVMKMVTQEGGRSLWRGILPNLAMSAPYSGLTFYFYSAYQTLLDKWWNKGEEGVWVSSLAVSGTAAGACAKLCVYPLDVLKKRLQIRGFEDARQHFGKVVVYRSPWSCVVQVTREEGVLAWYKGLWPAMIKSGIAGGVIFLAFETICALLAQRHGRKQEGDGG